MFAKLISAIILAGLLTACQSGETSSQERHHKQILTLNMHTEPPSLDPGQSSDSTSSFILSMLFDGLVSMGSDDTIQPAVAEEYSISDDRLTYTFKLRDSKWSNGMPVTSHDFEYAWRRTLDPEFPGDFAYHLYFIKGAKEARENHGSLDNIGIQTPDDKTIIVTLENPTPFFLELLILPCYFPLCEAVVKDNPNWYLDAGPDYVSNGPFKLVEWSHNNQIVVEKNPEYWNASHVKLSKIITLMVEDTTTELSLFDNGTIDWAGKPISVGLPTDSIPALAASGRLQTKPMAATYFYMFNVNKFPFNNEKLRKALAFAIDRKDIVKNIAKGNETPATCIVPPPFTLQTQECFKDADVEHAQRLFSEALEELNLTKESFPALVISYNTSEGHHKIAQAVQQQWRKALGIDVQLENQEWKVYLDKVQSQDFSIGRMSWLASYNDPFNFLDTFQYLNNPMNYPKWIDPAYTKLLEQSELESDPAKRKEILAKAERILIDAMPVVPVYFMTNTFLVNPSLKGYYMSPIGEVDFRYAYFEE